MDNLKEFTDRYLRISEKEAPKIREVKKLRNSVPIWQKGLLTLEEAAEYTGLGLHILRTISNDENCDFVLWNGTKRMFKRKKLDAYLDASYSI